MSFICPHCRAEMTDENAPCASCGQPQEAGADAGTAPESDSRFPVWKILPWTALAALLLFLWPHLRPHPAPAAQPSANAAPLTVAAPGLPGPATVVPANIPAEKPMAAQAPLTVTLYSADRGRHVPVGAPVMISAYAPLPPGQSATLAISYGKRSGPKSLLSLAQGSLCSTAWTPSAPGRYEFTASALDSRKTSAFSNHLSIQVDAAPQGRPVHRLVNARPSAVLPIRTAARQTKRRRLPPHPKPPISASPPPYHVAAATFPVQHIADTLAGALRRRGFHAIVRPVSKGHGKPTYTVETGDYSRRPDAKTQMRLLQHDGYPAYLFRAR